MGVSDSTIQAILDDQENKKEPQNEHSQVVTFSSKTVSWKNINQLLDDKKISIKQTEEKWEENGKFQKITKEIIIEPKTKNSLENRCDYAYKKK